MEGSHQSAKGLVRAFTEIRMAKVIAMSAINVLCLWVILRILRVPTPCVVARIM